MRPREPSAVPGARTAHRLQIARCPLPCGSVLAVVAAPGACVALVRLATLVAAGTEDAPAQVFTARTATACAPVSRTCGTKQMPLGRSPHLLAGSAFSATRKHGDMVPADSISLISRALVTILKKLEILLKFRSIVPI